MLVHMRVADVRGGGVQTPRRYLFEITGGNLALDLANTVDLRPVPARRDLLRGWVDLVDWSEQAHAVDAATARRLRRDGERRPEDAARVVRHTRRLRESIFRVFAGAAASASPPPVDIEALNDAVGPALRRLRIAPSGRGGFDWIWHHPPNALDVMLPPVVKAAADLLLDAGRLARVRVCEGEACRWLFLDLSKNRSRRWCDMSVCGNREKARRHQARLNRRAPKRHPAAG